MRKKVSYALLLGTFIVIPIIIYHLLDSFFQNPLDTNLHFTNPSFVAADPQNNMYIIDQSRKRIVKVSAAGDVDFIVEGGKRDSGSFFSASELTVDDNGFFYVLNIVLDSEGAYVQKEEIIRYNQAGKYDGTVYAKEYPEGEGPLREGWISSLSCLDGKIYCYFKGQDDVEMYTIPLNGGKVENKKILSLENARVMLVDIKGDGKGNFYYSTKKGDIYSSDSAGDPVLRYTVGGRGGSGEMSIPWRINADSPGNIFFTDLGQRKICKIDAKSGEISDLMSPASLAAGGVEGDIGAFYQFAVGEGGSLFTINDQKVIFQNKSGTVDFCRDSVKYPVAVIIYRLLLWFLPLAWLVILYILVRAIYINVMHRTIPRLAGQIFFILAAVSLTAAIVSNMLLSNMMERYEEKVMHNLSQDVQLASSIFDGDKIQRIERLDQFMDGDYNSVRDQLFNFFNNNNDPWNSGQYGVIYKVLDNKVYALMFYDDSIGDFYPIDFDYKNSIYFPVYDQGKIITQKDSDADGDWMYAVGPLHNSSGETVAMVEMGTDLFGFREENKKLITNIILDVATILVVLIFLLTEMSIFMDILYGRKRKRESSAIKDLIPEGADMVRPLGFLLFAGSFMSVSFIPVLMKDLYQPLFNLPESVVLGLPISAEMLFVALFSVLAGYMIDSRGWKPVFLTGVAVLGAGALLSGLTHNQLLFILARAVAGAGSGLAIIALETLAMSAPTDEGKSQGLAGLTSGVFSGMNVGVAVGAMLAEWAGFSNVFFAALAMVVLAGLFAYKIIPNFKAHAEEISEKISLAKVGKFFGNINVFAFFLLIFIPVSICGMFLSYFFPVFAEGAGVSASNIGRAFILNGLCIVYLGPFLTRHISKYLGARKAVLIFTLLVSAAILLFAYQGSVAAAYLAIVILGIADSFGITLLIDYFIGLQAASDLGHGKAMGYYSLVEYLGQMLGPIALGFVTILGNQKGMAIVGGALLAALVIFLLLSRKEMAARSADSGGMAV